MGLGSFGEKLWKRTKLVETRKNIQAAYEFLMRQDIKPYICPVLKSLTNDVCDIGKTLVPVLVPLALAGTISIPLDPIFFGILALMITKAGISTICPDDQKNDKEK